MDDEVWQNVDSLLDQSQSSVDNINNSTAALLGVEFQLIKPLFLPRPDRKCAELVFVRCILWFYGLFQECGGKALRFCIRQSQFSDPNEHARSFLDQLNALRTQLAHNLDLSSTSDSQTNAICKNWFRRVCRRDYPRDEAEWVMSLRSLLHDSNHLLKMVDSFLGSLFEMTDSDLLKSGLSQAITSSISPYAFDPVIGVVAKSLGRNNLNLKKFRADHLTEWRDTLAKLKEEYDFAYEATRLVERSMLETPDPPPITAGELMAIFGIEQGKEVGTLLEAAHTIYHSGVRNKDALIQQLKLTVGKRK